MVGVTIEVPEDGVLSAVLLTLASGKLLTDGFELELGWRDTVGCWNLAPTGKNKRMWVWKRVQMIKTKRTLHIVAGRYCLEKLLQPEVLTFMSAGRPVKLPTSRSRVLDLGGPCHPVCKARNSLAV